jgi:hypothetical protein
MAAKQQYFDDLNALLAAMEPGKIDMRQIEANERHHGHRFFDPPATVQKWLLDQQRRVQTRWPRAERQRRDGAPTSRSLDRTARHDAVSVA